MNGPARPRLAAPSVGATVARFARFALVGLAVVLAASAPADAAEWLLPGSRALARGASAGPDAPATGIGYGPRASSRLGGDVAIATWRRPDRTTRLGMLALVGFDNGASRSPLAGETGRTAVEVGLAWSFDAWAARNLGQAGLLELAATMGRRTAFGTERYLLGDEYHTDDVPFGAGGSYLGADAGIRIPLAAAWDVDVRLAGRAYLNAFADAAGSRGVSDTIADFLHEGAEWQIAVDGAIERRLGDSVRAYAALYAETIGPHDDTAKQLWLAHLEAGAALAAGALAWAPFVGAEAGHGPSLLVNRTELRLGVGFKIHAR